MCSLYWFLLFLSVHTKFFMEKRGNLEKWGKSVSGEALMERVYNQTNVIIPMRPVEANITLQTFPPCH